MATFKIGDLVWAKMRGFPPWPGVVAEGPKDLQKKQPKKTGGTHCIYFFGSKNYGWIETSNLQDYASSNIEQLKKGAKSAAFQEAVKAIDAQHKGGVPFNPLDVDAAFDRLLSSSNTPSRRDDHSESEESSKSDDVSKGENEANKTPKISTPTIPSSSSRPPKKRGRVSKTDEEGRPGISDSSLSDFDESKTPRKRKLKERSPGSAARGRATSPASTHKSSTSRKSSSYTDADTTTPAPHDSSFVSISSCGSSNNSYRKGLLERPPNISRPSTPTLDLEDVSQTLKMKKIKPSPLTFGFLGLGIMGSRIVRNLLNTGHKVYIWNRSPEKSNEFTKAGAEISLTPSDVVFKADITFSCVSDPLAAKEMVFGNFGVLREMNSNKRYVEMTGIDHETSLDIATAIETKGGRYLEAQLQGSKKEAEEGTLVILAAGDRSVYDECYSCFEAIGRVLYFLGDVGNASKMNLIIQMMTGVTLAGLAEGMALAERAGLQQSDILEVLGISSLNCPAIIEKGKSIVNCAFPTHLALNHMQKDLNMVVMLGHQLEQPLPMTASANEVFKHAKRLGYGYHDASAVYIRARF